MLDVGIPFPADNLQNGVGVQMLSCHPLWKEVRRWVCEVSSDQSAEPLVSR